MGEAELQALVKSIEELRESQRESRRETDRALRESSRETERFLKESAAKRDIAIEQAIRNLSGVFSTQWGRLVEALVEPSCVEQFQARGVKIARSFQRAEGIDSEGRRTEVDVLLVNGEEVVAVEVKTTLKSGDIDNHVARLSHFKSYFPEYASKVVLGAVAALRFDAGSDRRAYRKGLFVLRPSNGVARIVNDSAFRPRRF